MQEQYMTTEEAAELWGVTRITVLSWIHRGKLKAERFGWGYAIPKGTQRPADKRYVEKPVRNRRKAPQK